jgi:uncharacterized membrane protein YfcA
MVHVLPFGRPIAMIAIFLTGVAAGSINALSGGGSLLSFSLLTAMGLQPLNANVSNTVALLPGYLGAGLALRRHLYGQGRRAWFLLPTAALGGLAGGGLLLATGDRLFNGLVPWLILFGAGLLALQEPLKTWLLCHHLRAGRSLDERWSVMPILLASVYGGYFGAGLGVILLAVLGFCIDDNLSRLNGLKQPIALLANIGAGLLFMSQGTVDWPVVVVLGAGALLGGSLGGRLARRIDSAKLRNVVIAFGMIIGILLLFRRHHQ